MDSKIFLALVCSVPKVSLCTKVKQDESYFLWKTFQIRMRQVKHFPLGADKNHCCELIEERVLLCLDLTSIAIAGKFS